MTHPQLTQNLTAPRSEVQYHVQVFSKPHAGWLSSSLHENEEDAHSTADIVAKGFKGQYGARAPKVRVVKVAKHTLFSDPEEMVKNPVTPTMSPSERRKLEKMVADQAKGPNAGRKKPAPKAPAKPKRQVIDLSDVDTSLKKKGK